eukprot:TRINITY_DN70818_c0_g1_i1.p1 TRINITY_DN70818_c0_g1~~TRINITY_DN70818_c0_g1_i1.p1  ORF type:complete len:201 (+),score=32.96 TRINITY_DN70818_c0_g1_i1:55-657(+)
MVRSAVFVIAVACFALPWQGSCLVPRSSSTADSKLSDVSMTQQNLSTGGSLDVVEEHMDVQKSKDNLSAWTSRSSVNSTLEIEMPMVQEAQRVKSKVALAIISGFGLGACGIDRCYMGSTCLGITKGLTLGGLGIWAFVDFIVILINMLQKKDSINSLGFQAKFEPESEVDTAFWITVVLLMVKLFAGSCKAKASAGGKA